MNGPDWITIVLDIGRAVGILSVVALGITFAIGVAIAAIILG